MNTLSGLLTHRNCSLIYVCYFKPKKRDMIKKIHGNFIHKNPKRQMTQISINHRVSK